MLRCLGLCLVLSGILGLATNFSVSVEAAPISPYKCRTLVIDVCTGLGDTECQNYANCTGSCTVCAGATFIPNRTCVYYEPGGTCNTVGAAVNCGPRHVGVCNKKAGAACGCGVNGQPNGNCVAVFGC